MESLIVDVVACLCHMFPQIFWAAYCPSGASCGRVVASSGLDEITVFLLLPENVTDRLMFEVTVRHAPLFCMDPDPVHVHVFMETPQGPSTAQQIADKTFHVCQIFHTLKQLREERL